MRHAQLIDLKNSQHKYTPRIREIRGCLLLLEALAFTMRGIEHLSQPVQTARAILTAERLEMSYDQL